MVKRKTFVVITLLLGILSTLSFSFILRDVQFEGLKTVQQEELKHLYAQYLGKDVNNYAAEDIVSSIDDTGYFDSITYDLQDIEGKENEKILVIKVQENAPVSKVRFEVLGPGAIAKETLESSITLKEGKPFSFYKFWESIDNIAKIYTDAGYTVATPRIQDKSFAFVYVLGKIDNSEVTFKVIEHVLSDVEFEVASDDQEFRAEFENLKKQIMLPKYGDYESKNAILKIFDSPKNYIPTLQKLQEFFQNLSKYVYLKIIDISVVEQESQIPSKKMIVTLTDNTLITQPIKLKGIRVKGNTVFSEKELVGEIVEATYTNFSILKKIQAVKDKYDKNGYYINLGLELVDDGYLYVKVAETKVRNIKIVGNEVTKTYVFDDLIAVKPGDYFNRTQLQTTYIELKKLNFFKDVNINVEPTDSGDLDVVVTVIEKDKKFDFQGGVTWGPVKDRPWYEGFAGLLSLSSINPFGYGESFSISLQKALLTTNLSLNFGIRKPAELPIIINSSIAFNQETQEGTTTTKYTVSGGISTLKTPLGQVSLSGGYTDTTVSSETTLNTKTANVTGTYIYETLDNLFVPMSGYSLTLSGTKYIPLSETGSDAMSYFVEATYHLPLSQNSSIATRIYNAQVFQNSGAPVNFSLVGPYQVRGVKSEEKGTVLVLNNNEIRFKEPDQMFYLSLFYDLGFIGNAYSFDNLKSSAGLELGLVVPMFGLIRVGWGLQTLPTFTTNPNFYFIFGQTF
ncbi:BamA/OMP85 family outer membrane protein [Fervidobacterium sp.]